MRQIVLSGTFLCYHNHVTFLAAETSPTKVRFLPLTSQHGKCLANNNNMITFLTDNCNPISQNLYDKSINNLQFHQLVCSCGHCACLSIHAYYVRRVKVEDLWVSIRICRVKCSNCLKTHALLPSSIVPYSQISLLEQVQIISSYEHSEGFSSVMDQHPSIDESNLRYIIRQYCSHWIQRLYSASLVLSSSRNFVSQCFSSFSRQFMQIKRTTNVLFLGTT